MFLQKFPDKELMKRNFLHLSIFLISLGFCTSVHAIPKGTVESTSEVNWITRKFVSNIALDTKKAQLQMPSGKQKASAHIKNKMPELIQPPLLSLYADSYKTLSDYVLSEDISLDDLYGFIMGGYKTPDVFSTDAKKLKTTNTLNINNIGRLLVRHKYPYSPEEPVETVPTREYSGIIIDARGSFIVHGEYVKDTVYPCFFPKIWDEKMNIIYERGMVDVNKVKTEGLIVYDYADSPERYESRIGSDPLYIRAVEVFGRNRTDPVIKREDALKILSSPKNQKLLNEGKVVILLDKARLIYNVATPEPTQTFYEKTELFKQDLGRNPVPGVTISTTDVLKYQVQLNFYPDSSELLPGEIDKILYVSTQLKDLLVDDGYTILIEGHTADVDKPVGQLKLSIERALTVRDALISEGLSSKIFTYKGCGGTIPIASNDTEEGRAQNRRVEITVRPRATYIRRDN